VSALTLSARSYILPCIPPCMCYLLVFSPCFTLSKKAAHCLRSKAYSPCMPVRVAWQDWPAVPLYERRCRKQSSSPIQAASEQQQRAGLRCSWRGALRCQAAVRHCWSTTQNPLSPSREVSISLRGLRVYCVTQYRFRSTSETQRRGLLH